MNDISKIFRDISQKKGNKFAEKAIADEKNKKIEMFLDKYIEFISVNLQAEFNRILCSPLGQLKTQYIGNKLKEIIEEHIARVIYLAERENKSNPFVKDYFEENMKNLNDNISKNYEAEKALRDIYEVNLLNDFKKIVDILCNFEIQIVDPILRFLILLHIQRRLKFRGIIPK
ncbi:MAG: hypothetical protein EU539_08605 [Promethearchaeota archaeon]|nr:MAG: hypothetical protein EU539_08605 [Candidatus Lokiarchaeota archaeon]